MRLRPRPEVYLFLLWSEARTQEARILADLATRFTVLDLVEVTWTPDDTFSANLSRMYGDALPPGSDKERHCGTGPFLVVVVEDPHPRLRLRHTGRGRKLQNSAVYDARLRYREWTGGGYRVHASDSVVETERNLVLLLGEGIADVTGRRPPQEGFRERRADAVGAHGWDSVPQLLRTLRPYGARPLGPVRSDGATVQARDVWWAERIAGGREAGPAVREVTVAGEPLVLTFVRTPPPEVRLVNALTRRLPGWGAPQVPS